MKKYITILAAITFAFAANAQKAERTTAYMALQHYISGKDPAELAKAKLHIDNASKDPSTSGDAQTWVYRGQIYLNLYQKELADNLAKHADITEPNKKNAAAFLETPTANVIEATNSFLKAKQLDTKTMLLEDETIGLNSCYSNLQNAGVTRYNNSMYAESEPLFELAVDVAASSKVVDSLNTSNAANAAFNAKMNDKAAAMFKKLCDMGYGKGNSWLMLGKCYLAQGDSAQYLQAIQDGMKKYPNDGDLLTEDVNIKMAKGQNTAAIDELNALVAQRPNDAQLNLVVGNVYDHMANPKDAAGKDLPKPSNYADLVDQSAKYYMKAIELDPKNTEALYSIGVLYYNQSQEYYTRSTSTIADAAKYTSMWDKKLPEAAKYLEAAVAIDPKDISSLTALKATYGQLGDDANYTRVKDLLTKAQSAQ